MDGINVEAVHVATSDLRDLIDALDRELALQYLPEQQHGVSFDALFQTNMRFFMARFDGVGVGCGGVALLGTFGEVKRMYVRGNMRGRGIARALLSRIEAETTASGIETLRLETGDQQRSAMRFYERAGFLRCDPFGDYASMTSQAIATSVFYEKRLELPLASN